MPFRHDDPIYHDLPKDYLPGIGVMIRSILDEI